MTRFELFKSLWMDKNEKQLYFRKSIFSVAPLRVDDLLVLEVIGIQTG